MIRCVFVVYRNGSSDTANRNDDRCEMVFGTTNNYQYSQILRAEDIWIIHLLFFFNAHLMTFILVIQFPMGIRLHVMRKRQERTHAL